MVLEGDIHWATRVGGERRHPGPPADALGVLNIVRGVMLAGIWQMLIGFFHLQCAGASRTGTELRHELRDVPPSRVMSRQPISVPSDISLQELVDRFFYRYHLKFFPVEAGDRLVGCVPERSERAAARGLGRQACERHHALLRSRYGRKPQRPCIDVLRKMQQTGNGRLLVAKGDKLEGIVTADDIMNYVAVRMELREETRLTPELSTTRRARG